MIIIIIIIIQFLLTPKAFFPENASCVLFIVTYNLAKTQLFF